MKNTVKTTTTLSNKPNFENTAVPFRHKSNLDLLKSHFLFSSMNNPTLVGLGTSLVTKFLKWQLPIKSVIKKTLFEQFCGGEDRDDCNRVIQQLGNSSIGTILDYAVEGATDEKGFERTEKETIENIAKASINQHIPFCVFKPTGLGPNKVLEKLHIEEVLTEEEESAYQRMLQRFKNICGSAAKHKVKVLVDAEETWFQNPLDAIVYEMMEKYNQEEAIVYNTYQMYCREKLSHLKSANEIALQKGYKIGAKLVRGAYMEKERERAQEKGYQDPIQPNKQATDIDFNLALEYCMEHLGQIAILNGSHNEESNYYLAKLLEEAGLAPNHPDVYFAQLYGMSDHISFNLSHAGYNVAKYVPYGPLEAVLPYLFRRAEENTSIAGQSSRELNLIRNEIKRRKNR